MPGGQRLRVQLLGPVQAWHGAQEVNLGSLQQRAVLAVLAMSPDRVLSRDELIDAVWDSPPAKADAAVYSYVCRLRNALEPDRGPRGRGAVLVTAGAGYALRVGGDQVDAAAFAAGVKSGRQACKAGDLGRAEKDLGGALALWRGTALAGVAGHWAGAQRVRLDEARLAAIEERAEVSLALGRHGETAAELATIARSHPLREGLRRLQMLALYRSGRQAEALAVFHDTRRVLAEELGIEPGAALAHLHQQVLTADPAIDLPASPPGTAGHQGPGGEVGAAAAEDVSGAPGHAGTGPDRGPSAAPYPGGQRGVPRSRASVPHELPADVSAFTGREDELAFLDRCSAAAGIERVSGGGQVDADGTAGGRGPVVVALLTGTAGAGKTALAVRWAHRTAGQFPDGQVYVNLRGYDPDQPVPAAEALAQLLRSLGAADADIPLTEDERASRWRSLVAGRRLLVVLDNAASVEHVRPLLPGGGPAMALVTSRDSLAGLVAVNGAQRVDVGLLSQDEAVTLLRSLIGTRVDAEPDAAGRLAAACARLPLALRVAAELAVGRTGEPLVALATELTPRRGTTQLLDPGGDAHSAVATVFSWSHRHLPADTARMFRLVGLHPATDFGSHAAAALLTGAGAPAGQAQAKKLLAALTRAHLVATAGPDRYTMHDLLRSYAGELAVDQDGEEVCHAALTALFDCYLAACSAAMDILVPAEKHRRPELSPAEVAPPVFADRASARAWLDSELPALVTVAGHTATAGWPAHTVRLAATITPGYLDIGHTTEAMVVLGHALDAARHCGDLAAQASVLTTLGYIYYEQARPGQAIDSLRQAIDLARDCGDRKQEARALGQLASAYSLQGHYQRAGECYQQALGICRDTGDAVGEAINLANHGLLDIRQGRYGDAAGRYEGALALFRTAGHRYGEVNALHNLGEACYRQGRYEQAMACQREALAASEEIGWQMGEAYALTGLGDVLHRQGRYGQATEHLQRAAALFETIGDMEGQACALNSTGEAFLATGQTQRAHTCHTAARSLADRSGDQREHARGLAGLGEVCRALGDHERAAGFRDEALAMYRQVGDPAGEADVLNRMGRALLVGGWHDQARDCHTSALALARQTGDRYQQARAHQGLAGAYHVAGQPTHAWRERQRAFDIFRDLQVPEAFEAHATPPRPPPADCSEAK